MPSHYANLELCRYLNLQWINNPMSPKCQICHGTGTVRQSVICGPWWGRGEAGDLDLGMHWWLVRNNCVQQEIWKGFFMWHPSSGVWQEITVKTLCFWILEGLAILGMAGLFAVMKMLVVTLADLLCEKLLISGYQDLRQSHHTLYYILQ